MTSRVVDIKYNLESQECFFIDSLAKLDVDLPAGKTPIDFEKNIMEKLFKKMVPDNPNSLYLKNKYLYYLAEGALGYLEAIYSMHTELSEINNYETEEVVNQINELLLGANNKKIFYISLGCGDGEKDLKIIKLLKPKITLKDSMYIPIDISPYLLQLAIQKCNEEISDLPITSIYSDFFDFDGSLASVIPNNPNVIRVFTLLGSTIGNYKEKDLLSKISKLMSPNDYLIVGFELYDDRDTLEKQISKYYTDGNYLFLMQPFKLIPKYRGYLDYPNRYFKLRKDTLTYNTSITDIKGSLSYTPHLKIPTRDGQKTIYMAWSTKYKVDNLKNEFFLEDNLDDILLQYCNKFPINANGNYGLALLKRLDDNTSQLKNNYIEEINVLKGGADISSMKKKELENLITLIKNCTDRIKLKKVFEVIERNKTIPNKEYNEIIRIFNS